MTSVSPSYSNSDIVNKFLLEVFYSAALFEQETGTQDASAFISIVKKDIEANPHTYPEYYESESSLQGRQFIFLLVADLEDSLIRSFELDEYSYRFGEEYRAFYHRIFLKLLAFTNDVISAETDSALYAEVAA